MLTNFCWSQNKVISKIELTGLKRTKESFVKKQIQIKEGALLDTMLIQRDIRKLQGLVAIAKASYLIEEIDANYKITYQLEENLTLIPQLNVWTVNDNISYSIGLSEFNLFGRNIKLGGFYQNNGYDSYGGTFSSPSLFSKKWGLSAEYQNWTSEEPLHFNDFSSIFRYNNERVELLIMHQLNEKNSFAIGGGLFSEKYNYKSGDDPLESSIPRNLKQDKSMLKLVYTYNNIKYDYYLLSGFKSVLNVQTVATENNFANLFSIAFNDFSYFKQFGLKGNFATRIRLGIASNIDSPFAPFALDNNLNIRGVGNTIDRGSASAVWNIEYRRTIIEKKWFVLQANIFTDAGSWRTPGGKLSEIIDHNNFRIYAGGGLRFMHKKIYNAIFRIDYGYGLFDENSSGIVIGIGQYF